MQHKKSSVYIIFNLAIVLAITLKYLQKKRCLKISDIPPTLKKQY